MRHDKSESTHIYDNILYAWFSLSILKKDLHANDCLNSALQNFCLQTEACSSTMVIKYKNKIVQTEP